MISICLVEDEEKVAAFISKGLQEYNYQITHAADGASAMAIIGSQVFDLLILDVMLPDISGLKSVRLIKQNTYYRFRRTTAKSILNNVKLLS